MYRVVVTGVPDRMLLEGESFQLSAVGVNESGAATSATGASWQETDTTIARVSATGLVTVTGAGHAAIVARLAEKYTYAEFNTSSVVAFPASGALVRASGGKVALFGITPGTQGPLNFYLQPFDARDDRVVAASWSVSTPSPNFNGDANITLRFDPTKLPAGTPVNALEVFSLSGGTWKPIRERAQLDVANHTVSARFLGTAAYAILADPVAMISLGGAGVDATLAIGASTLLSARTLGADGLDLPTSRTVTWASQDPQVAIVNSDGRVTALKAGRTTVTATSEGKSASTIITVSP